MMGNEHSGQNHLRFYIVMITMVVGIIFLFLFMNKDGEGFGLTSAFMGGDENLSSTVESLKTSLNKDLQTDDELAAGEWSSTNTNRKNFQKIGITMSFNEIPSVKKEAKIDQMELRFTNLDTIIKVNNDKLELNNLQEVSLRIKGFLGELTFDENGISLTGRAKRLEVNNIALSSAGEIDLSFSDLNYEFMNINDLDLKEILLPQGSGKSEVADKLQYTLSDEEVSLSSFIGQLSVDKNAEMELELEGDVKSVSVNGETMNLGLN